MELQTEHRISWLACAIAGLGFLVGSGALARAGTPPYMAAQEAEQHPDTGVFTLPAPPQTPTPTPSPTAVATPNATVTPTPKTKITNPVAHVVTPGVTPSSTPNAKAASKAGQAAIPSSTSTVAPITKQAGYGSRVATAGASSATKAAPIVAKPVTHAVVPTTTPSATPKPKNVGRAINVATPTAVSASPKARVATQAPRATALPTTPAVTTKPVSPSLSAAASNAAVASVPVAAATPKPEVWTQIPNEAEGSTPAANAGAVGKRARSGLMWEAKSGQNKAYLVGSVHVASAEMYPLPEQIEEAFDRSTELLVEINLDKVDSAKMFSLVSANGMYPAGDTLWNHVGANTRDLVTHFCEEHGLPAAQIGQFKLWMVAVTVSAAVMQSFGLRPELGIDQHFLSEANNGKRVEQLESTEQQVHIMASLPEPAEEKSLDKLLENPRRMKVMFEKLQSAWLDGDASAIDKLIVSELGDFPGEEKMLLNDRNPHMADAVAQCLDTRETCFMVVGAGHLVGKTGVVQLLKQRGIKVEQVLAK